MAYKEAIVINNNIVYITTFVDAQHSNCTNYTILRSREINIDLNKAYSQLKIQDFISTNISFVQYVQVN
jgi:hypothetical protein